VGAGSSSASMQLCVGRHDPWCAAVVSTVIRTQSQQAHCYRRCCVADSALQRTSSSECACLPVMVCLLLPAVVVARLGICTVHLR
jgi:hypothetical protein